MTNDRAPQASNSYSVVVGDAKVTVILDSLLPFPYELVTGADPAGVEQRHLASGHRGTPTATINAVLIEKDQHLILLDAGLGGSPQPSASRLVAELATLAVKPDDITHVLFTHLHLDHAGGAITSAGEPVFINAQHVAHRDEEQYWFGGQVPPGGEPVLVQYEFAQRLRPMLSSFNWADEGPVLPGIDLVHLPGHTPGHSGYRLRARNEDLVLDSAISSLFCWGDIVHQPQLQFTHPELGVAFDADREVAIETRRRVLRETADSGELVAGHHLHFPAIGRVLECGQDEYRFVPSVWFP